MFSSTRAGDRTKRANMNVHIFFYIIGLLYSHDTDRLTHLRLVICHMLSSAKSAYGKYVCLDVLCILFANGAMSSRVSVKTFQDVDAIFEHDNKFEMIPPFWVTEDDIQPGIVFLSNNRLLDKIKWGMTPTMLVRQN